ncbi:MAG TPA: hypothetical protein VFZ76_05205 [Anaerolineales bacterium]
MSKEKRTFESNALSVTSINLQSIFEVDKDCALECGSPSVKREISFSKEMVLRLIEWLEQK